MDAAEIAALKERIKLIRERRPAVAKLLEKPDLGSLQLLDGPNQPLLLLRCHGYQGATEQGNPTTLDLPLGVRIRGWLH